MWCSSYSRYDYIKEVEWQCGNKEYKMLDSDPAEIHKKLVDQTIDRFKWDKMIKHLKKKMPKNLK